MRKCKLFKRVFNILRHAHFIYTSCSPLNKIYLNPTIRSLQDELMRRQPTFTCKDHLGPRNVLLWVSQVDVQGLLLPGDPLVLVCLGVTESRRLPSFTTNKTPKIRTYIYVYEMKSKRNIDADKLPCLCFPPCSTV